MNTLLLRTLACCLLIAATSCSKKKDGDENRPPGNGGPLDIDQDTYPDLVMLRVTSTTQQWSVDVYSDGARATDLSVGAATLQIAGTGLASGLALCDMDGDGLTDLLVGIEPDILMWPGSSFATWDGDNPPVTFQDVGSYRIECVDVTGDGIADLITEFEELGAFQPGLAVIPGSALLAPGVIDFPSSTDTIFLNDINDPGIRGLELGDINGDGNVDILTVATNNPAATTQSGEIAIHLGGPGLASTPGYPGDISIPGDDTADIYATIADVNDDGTMDVVRAVDGALELYDGGTLAATGNTPATSIPISANPNFITALDGLRFAGRRHDLLISTTASLFRTEIQGDLASATTCSTKSSKWDQAYDAVAFLAAFLGPQEQSPNEVCIIGGSYASGDDDDDAECEGAALCVAECVVDNDGAACPDFPSVAEDVEQSVAAEYADCLADCL